LLLDRFVDSPRSAEVGLKLAQQLYRDGRLIPAGEWVQTLLDRFPNWPRRHQLSALQAKIWGQMSDTTAKQQAVAALETALRDLERLSGDDEATGSGRSRDDWKAVYLYELAWLEQELGQSQRAEERFAAIQLGHPTSRYWADATFRLAQSHFRQGRLTQAAELLEQIVQADHTADDPVSDVPASGGVPARTVSQSRAVGEGSGGNTAAPVAAEILCQTLYLRAMVSASEKDWPAVATLSERLVTEFPAHRLRWLAQYWWGEACFRLQRFPQAIELLTAILPRTDAQADSWVAMSHLRLAQSYGHLDRWREALHVAEPARRRFTDFAQLYELDYLIGRALATEGQFPQSRVAYQQVIDSPTGRATETAAMAQWMIGETYFHQEQFALAAEAYHRTETLYPFPQWQAAALYQAGQCYEQLRRDRDAENVYRQLLREHAQCSLAARAQERLEQLSTRLEIEAPRPPQAAGGSR
jgi:TolA-binding protein